MLCEPLAYEAFVIAMVDSPRRHISDPIKGDRWRYQTVYGHISTPVITQSQRLQQRKRRRVEEDPPTPARSFIEDYNKRKAATARFPPKITPQHIRAAMRKYEQVIEDACKGVEASCASCGEFIAKAGSELIPVDDDRLGSMKPPEDAILLDDCSVADGSYQVCKACFNDLNGRRIPKFSALNAVNVTMCQHYPAELEDLTLMEEYAIARSHPIGTILKLKPNGARNPTAYNGIRGHLVTIPQDPGPLLDILPSPDLQFHDHIRVIWTGKTEPTVDDVRCTGYAKKMRMKIDAPAISQLRVRESGLRMTW